MWGGGGRERETDRQIKESEELKTVSMKPRCDFSEPVWEIAAKGNGERASKMFV